MGQLLFVKSIDNAPWYFEDARYNSETRGFTYSWPNPSYPYSAAIQEQHIVQSKAKVTVRRWVELNLQETVIYGVVDNSYRAYFGKERTWETSYEKRNTWIVFYFDNEHSALAFKLAFADLVRPITKHHPDSPEDEEWCNKKPGERL